MKSGWRIIKHMLTDPMHPYLEGSEEMFQNGHVFIRDGIKQEEVSFIDGDKKVVTYKWFRCVKCGMRRKDIPNPDRNKFLNQADNLTCADYEALIVKDIIE